VVLREYELVYLLHPDLSAERETEIHGRMDQNIAKGEGILLLRDDWGRRKLAYELLKLQKAHYFMVSFLGNGTFINDIERDLRLDPDVLRFLTVQKNDKVKDVQARIEHAKTELAEQQRRREQREREAQERAERERRTAGEGGGGRSDNDDDADED
jgi:small subunit ribosomal protein S6